MSQKSKTEPPISKARSDGRPQYYDLPPEGKSTCAVCVRVGILHNYPRGQVFMADPGNSPFNDGGVYTVCKEHLKPNAVIHDPVRNITRTADGQNAWTQPDATSGKLPPSFEEPVT